MLRQRPLRRYVLGVCLALAGGIVPASSETPTDAETHFSMGVSYLRNGRLDLAVEEFRIAVKQQPKNSFFLKGLGLAYAQQGKSKEAAELLRKALELDPTFSDLRNDLGSVLIQAGRRDEGKKELMTAFSDPMNPTPEISSRNLGQAFLEEKNCAEAQTWFRASIEKNKVYVDAHLGLADTLVCLGQLDNAIIQLEAAATHTSDNPDILVALGEALFKAGRFGEARARLETAAKKDPAGRAGRHATELLKNFPK